MMERLIYNRKVQANLLAFIIFVVIAIIFLGIITFKNSPLLVSNNGFVFPADGQVLVRIESVVLDNHFFKKLPEFFLRENESLWWDNHKKIADLMVNNGVVSVEWLNSSGVRNKADLQIVYPGYVDIIKNLGVIYFVAFIYVISAISVFVKHRDSSGVVLAFFLIFCSLYFVSAAPVVSRAITLPAPYFQILISFLYIGAAGLIALTHYSFIFPKPKEFLVNFPISLHTVIYGYALTTILLYLSGLIAFGATFPLMLLIITVMIGAFIHSMVREQDVFLKKQLALSLFTPVVATVCFVFLSILPGVIGVEPIDFTYFALISFILPFGLISAMDNYRLYQERVNVEKHAANEKERVRQDLHDNILNKLANISLLSELSLTAVGKDNGSVIEKLGLIKGYSKEYSRQLRGLLWITDEKNQSWEEYCSQIRKYGYSVMEPQGIDFELECIGEKDIICSNFTQQKVSLYYVISEALLNIVKHSGASIVRANLSITKNSLSFMVEDNGIGFEHDKAVEGHYGLANMQKRIETLEGEFQVIKNPDCGVKVIVEIPLSM